MKGLNEDVAYTSSEGEAGTHVDDIGLSKLTYLAM